MLDAIELLTSLRKSVSVGTPAWNVLYSAAKHLEDLEAISANPGNRWSTVASLRWFDGTKHSMMIQYPNLKVRIADQRNGYIR